MNVFLSGKQKTLNSTHDPAFPTAHTRHTVCDQHNLGLLSHLRPIGLTDLIFIEPSRTGKIPGGPLEFAAMDHHGSIQNTPPNCFVYEACTRSDLTKMLNALMEYTFLRY